MGGGEFRPRGASARLFIGSLSSLARAQKLEDLPPAKLSAVAGDPVTRGDFVSEVPELVRVRQPQVVSHARVHQGG